MKEEEGSVNAKWLEENVVEINLWLVSKFANVMIVSITSETTLILIGLNCFICSCQHDAATFPLLFDERNKRPEL